MTIARCAGVPRDSRIMSMLPVLALALADARRDLSSRALAPADRAGCAPAQIAEPARGAVRRTHEGLWRHGSALGAFAREKVQSVAALLHRDAAHRTPQIEPQDALLAALDR